MTNLVSKTTLSGPNALVAAIPYLVGFHPTDSLVAVWVRDGRILVTQRADLEESFTHTPELIAPVIVERPDEVIFVVYGHATEGQLIALVAAVTVLAPAVYIKDILWCRDGRWGSLTCEDPSCCPPEGKEINVADAANLVGLGMAPLPSREAMEKQFTPTGTVRVEPVPTLNVEPWRDEAISTLTVIPRDPSPVELRDAGRLLSDIKVRDVILWRLGTCNSKHTVEQWANYATAITRNMHPDDAANPAIIASVCNWMLGDGARATAAVRVALASADRDELAETVDEYITDGATPDTWPRIMAMVTEEFIRGL